MRILIGSLILVSGLSAGYAWACNGGGCSNSDATNVGKGCRLAHGASNSTCFISVSGMANNCYKIVNSSGLDVFIPTNSGATGNAEFQKFVTNPPASVTVTGGTAGSNCWPSCWTGGGCPATPGSAVNPP